VAAIHQRAAMVPVIAAFMLIVHVASLRSTIEIGTARPMLQDMRRRAFGPGFLRAWPISIRDQGPTSKGQEA